MQRQVIQMQQIRICHLKITGQMLEFLWPRVLLLAPGRARPVYTVFGHPRDSVNSYRGLCFQINDVLDYLSQPLTQLLERPKLMIKGDRYAQL